MNLRKQTMVFQLRLVGGGYTFPKCFGAERGKPILWFHNRKIGVFWSCPSMFETENVTKIPKCIKPQ